MKTSMKCQATFMIPELHDNRVIDYDIHMADDLGAHDMIIGRDVLSDLGIDLRFSNQTIEWDESQIPFKNIDATLEEAFHIDDPELLDNTKSPHIKPVPQDNDYAAADLDEICKSQTQLTEEQ